MAIPVQCPACASRFSAPDEAAGRKARCPSCSAPLTVPVPGSEPVALPSKLTQSAPTRDEPKGNGFGVGSFVLGLLALLICWIPLIGLAAWPLAGVGIILGIVGIVAASKDHRKRSALAIGGTIVGALAIVVSGTIVVFFARAITQVVKDVEKNVVEEQQKRNEPKPLPGPDETALAALDRNSDGRLSADEMPERFRDQFGKIDGNDDGYADAEEWTRALARAEAQAPQRGPVMATSILVSADDFVIDVFHNGERVPYDRRQVAGENYGATTERINIEVHEGDWVVFNVANNRLRWDGASYFGAAGLRENEPKIAFASETTSGRWSFCDDPGSVPRFIAEADFLANQAARPPANPWGGGAGELTGRAPGWSGTPVWGSDQRNTWIKFNARPAPEDSHASDGPKPEQAATAPSEPAAPAQPSPANAPALKSRVRLEGAPGLIYSALFAPDGRTVITTAASTNDPNRPNFLAKEPGTLLAWDVPTARIRRGFRFENSLLSAAIVGAGKRVAAGDISGNEVLLFDLASGRRTSSLTGPPRSAAMRVAVSADGKKLAAAYDTNTKVVMVWDLASSRAIATLREHDQPVSFLAFSPDGERLATAVLEGAVILWDLASAKPLATINPGGQGDSTGAVTFTPDGAQLAVTNGGKLRFYDAKTGAKAEGPALADGESCLLMLYSPDGRLVATTSTDFREKVIGTIQVRDARTLATLATAEEAQGEVRALAFSPDGSTLATSSGVVATLWDVPPPR